MYGAGGRVLVTVGGPHGRCADWRKVETPSGPPVFGRPLGLSLGESADVVRLYGSGTCECLEVSRHGLVLVCVVSIVIGGVLWSARKLRCSARGSMLSR